MAYVLRAIIARCEVLAPPPAWIADSAVVELPQGFCMVPLTTALREQFGPPERPWLYPTWPPLIYLPEGLVPHLVELSRRGRVACVEAEYHGGDGEQRAIVWEDGAPLEEPEEHSYAINSALGRLGVERAEGEDAFDTLGLGRYRDVEDWVQSVRRPASPPPAAPAPEPPRKPWWRFWCG